MCNFRCAKYNKPMSSDAELESGAEKTVTGAGTANLPTFKYGDVTVLGEGSYGCILQRAVPCGMPRLPFRSDAATGSTSVYKIMNSKAAAGAWQMNELMLELDPASQYTVPLTQACDVTEPDIRAKLLTKCSKSLSSFNPLTQLTMPLGVEYLNAEYAEAAPYFQDAFVHMLNVVKFAEICDEHAIAHGDIKTPNLLLVNGTLRYIDFDLTFSYTFDKPPLAVKARDWRSALQFPPSLYAVPTACFGDVGYFPPECSVFKRTYVPGWDTSCALREARNWLGRALSWDVQRCMKLFKPKADTAHAAFVTHVLSSTHPKQAAYHPEKLSVFQLGLVLAVTLNLYGVSESDAMDIDVMKLINKMTRVDPRRRITIQDARGVMEAIIATHFSSETPE